MSAETLAPARPTPARTVSAHAHHVEPRDIDPAERGRTTIADRVIEKTAAQAATEVEHTAELSPRLADRLPGRRARSARAQATVSGRLVQLRVMIAVDYPVPVVRVTREVRTHVRETVSRVCDVEVRDVDVVVDGLHRTRVTRRVS